MSWVRCGFWLAAVLCLCGPLAVAQPLRLWVDVDAACGHSERTDPDDCLALLLLAREPRVELVGISTVFGNAPLEVTDAVTRKLAGFLAAEGNAVPPIYRGAVRPVQPGEPPSVTPAAQALRAALSRERLVIAALGPLTNLVAALEGATPLQARVSLIVAVMGKREGHIFHPAEGGDGGMLFGHGPIFTDFNVRQDLEAVRRFLPMGLPTVLVPYETARQVSLGAAELNGLARSGAAGAWAANRTMGWLEYWRENVGREGFFPFDLVAVAHLLAPEFFTCREESARVETDRLMLGIVDGPDELLVGTKRDYRYVPGWFRPPAPDPLALVPRGVVTYCTQVAPELRPALSAALAGQAPLSAP